MHRREGRAVAQRRNRCRDSRPAHALPSAGAPPPRARGPRAPCFQSMLILARLLAHGGTGHAGSCGSGACSARRLRSIRSRNACSALASATERSMCLCVIVASVGRRKHERGWSGRRSSGKPTCAWRGAEQASGGDAILRRSGPPGAGPHESQRSSRRPTTHHSAVGAHATGPVRLCIPRARPRLLQGLALDPRQLLVLPRFLPGGGGAWRQGEGEACAAPPAPATGLPLLPPPTRVRPAPRARSRGLRPPSTCTTPLCTVSSVLCTLPRTSTWQRGGIDALCVSAGPRLGVQIAPHPPHLISVSR